MASIKRPTYKVETKLAADRKRRKSDLVIMWQSIWGVTVIIVNELWMTLIRMWEFLQLWFSSSERFLVQTWLEKYLPYVPEDFSESWRDGCLMAILLNKLRPGCFPDANRLDPDYGLKNVYRVFDALEIYFGIKPNVSVEEIVTCIDESGSNLFEIFLELKKLTDNQPEYQFEPEPEKENVEQTAVRECCIAKGTGLTLGFVGKITNFIIYYTAASDLDIVVEIRGPNTICSERITNRSPKKKRSMCTWEYTRSLTKSVSLNQDNDGLPVEEDENFEKIIIPLEYEIISNQIRLRYKPREKGKHRVTILWHRHHILDSPYIVTVEDPSEISGINKVLYFKSALKTTNECEKNKICDKSRKISVRFQDGVGNCRERQKGKIISRRILRYIVKIRGKDVPVNAENPESLATELLKMDYDIEKCPSFHRRNSWGFTGDAERKKSVIRQFCIDVNELDAQISQRRTRSLSINPETKTPMQKCGSFESLTSSLNIVNEVAFESHHEKSRDNEGDYAYIKEDPDETNQNDEVKHNDDDDYEVISHASILEKEPSSELTEIKFAESLKKNLNCEIDAGKISSLSTDMIRVDNFDADLQSNISQSIPVNEPRAEKINKMPLNNRCSDMNSHLENREIHSQNGGNDSKTPERLQKLNPRKPVKKHSKIRKNYANIRCSCSCSSKKYRIKTKNEKIPTQASYGKVSRKTNSTSLSPISTFIEPQEGNNEDALEIEGHLSSMFLENRLKNSVELEMLGFEHEKDEITEDAQGISTESLNISQLVQNTSNDEHDTPSMRDRCMKNTTENKLTEVIHTSKNIIHEEAKTRIICTPSKNHELKAKKVDLNHNANIFGKIYSLSTDMIRVDYFDEDLQSNISQNVTGNEPRVEKISKIPLNNRCSDMNLHLENREIHSQNGGNDSKTSERLQTNTSNDENDIPSMRDRCMKNTKENKLTEVIHTSKNIIHEEAKTKIICTPSKNHELKAKNVDINHNANAISTFLPHSKIETKDSNISETKPLRTLTAKPIEQFVINHSLNVFPTESESDTKHDEKSKSLRIHSLKSIGEFNFKQFTPFFETQNSISPIKLQIEHWESTLASERQDAPLQKADTSDTQHVSVNEKLAFWESACETEQIPSHQNKFRNRKTDSTGNQRNFDEDNSDAEKKNLHPVYPITGTDTSMNNP